VKRVDLKISSEVIYFPLIIAKKEEVKSHKVVINDKIENLIKVGHGVPLSKKALYD
jgi:hypothetical protein